MAHLIDVIEDHIEKVFQLIFLLCSKSLLRPVNENTLQLQHASRKRLHSPPPVNTDRMSCVLLLLSLSLPPLASSSCFPSGSPSTTHSRSGTPQIVPHCLRKYLGQCKGDQFSVYDFQRT